VDLGELKVVEGDSGRRTYRVPVRVTGRGSGRLRLFLTDAATFKTRSWVASFRPGTRTVEVPVEVVGDKLFGTSEASVLDAKVVRGAVIGDYRGGVLVTNDDPAPRITVERVAKRVAEGGTLSWRIRLSTAAESWIWAEGSPRPPVSGPELSTTDVDPEWFTDNTFGEDPLPARPLSETDLLPWTGVEPGQLTSTLTVPTVTDRADEPAKTLRLELTLSGWEDEEPPEPGTVTGTVTGRSAPRT
jgi:hypothetical protein